MTQDEIVRAWRGGAPWFEEIEEWTDRRHRVLPELSAVLADFLTGNLPLDAFSWATDSLSKRWNYWGFRGHSGQMFFNILRKTSDSSDVEAVLREALVAPIDEAEAERQIDLFARFVNGVRRHAIEEEIYPPKVGYVPYFVSFFWELQDRAWPIYYPRSREALVNAGLFREQGTMSERYLAFRRQIIDLTHRLETSTWGVEVLLFSLGRSDLVPAWRAESALRSSPGARTSSQFTSLLMQLLSDAGFGVTQDSSFGGTRPDLIATDPAGHLIVVEAKARALTGQARDRAAKQARLYREALGADLALTVAQDLEASDPDARLFRVEDVIAWMTRYLESTPSRIAPAPPLRPIDRTIFAAMPFLPEFEDVFFLGMAPAAEDNGATCVRVDHEQFVGDVVMEIKSRIGEASIVIGDVSKARQNVLYEMGYAEGVGKPVVQISSSPLHELPFDIRNQNTLRYTLGQVHRLRSALAARLRPLM